MPCMNCARCGYDLKPNRPTPYFCIPTREYHSGNWQCPDFRVIDSDDEPYAEVISVYNEREG